MSEELLNTAMSWSTDIDKIFISNDNYIEGQIRLTTKLRNRSLSDWSRSSKGSIRESQGKGSILWPNTDMT